MQNESIIIDSYCERPIQLLQNNDNNQIRLEFECYCADNLPLLQQIGDQLTKLQDLRHLSLIFNQNINLKQEALRYIFQGLEQLKQLQNLEIVVRESCTLEEQGLNLLSYAISSLTSLKKLVIEIHNFNYISGQSLKNLINNFKYLSQLEELRLYILDYLIEIHEEKFNLWSGLSSLQSIQDLDLSLNLQYNNEQDIDEFFQQLLSFKRLTKLALNLNYNQQKFSFVKKLTDYLQQLTQLKELTINLNQNVKVKEDTLLIYTFFRNLINLEKINLQSCFNSFFHKHSDEYYESLAFLPNLTDLKIMIDGETTGSDRKIAQCLNNKQKLKSVQIYSIKENLKDEIYDEIMQSLKYYNQLQSLDLIFHKFNKQSQSLALCESLKHMNQLKQLNFTIDHIQSKTADLNQVLKCIGKIKSLKELNLVFKSSTIYTDRKQQLALSHLRLLNLTSFIIQIESMLLSNEFLELGQVLQNQKDLQKLKILISFQEKKQQGFGFGFQANQQQLPNESNQIESIEDFIQGIKSLTNLKELYYGITHNSTMQILNQVLKSLQNLKNLEIFDYGNNQYYQESQNIQLSEAISNMKNLKSLQFQNFVCQQSLPKQIQQLQTLQNLEQLSFFIDCQNLNNSVAGFEQLFSSLYQLKIASFKILIQQDCESIFQDLFKGLQHLKNLHNLGIFLGNYEFTDNGADQFNQTCSGLQNLRTLNFEKFVISTNFTEQGADRLRDGFCKLKKLIFLGASFQIPRIEISKILQGVFNNIYLSKISLNFETRTEFNSNDVIEIEKPIKEKCKDKSKDRNKSNLTQIQTQFQFGQQCQVEDFAKFYEQFEDFQNLSSLSVIHDWDIHQFQNLIECTKMLENLFCSFKQFKKMKGLQIQLKNSSYNFEKIPIQNMKYLTNLSKLELTLLKNNIVSDHLLFDQLQYFTYLQSLKIEISEETPFSKNAAISLGNSLTKLKQLQTLDLIFSQNCSIEQEGAIQIGIGIGYLNCLSSFNIYLGVLCQIKEDGAMKIAEGISKIFTLNDLSLNICGQNKVGKQAGAALASSIKSSKYLTQLFFQIQNESGSVQGQQFLNEISKSLSELKLLKSVLLCASFDENLEYCPEQLKQFICYTCTSKVMLTIQNQFQQLQTTLKSEDLESKIELVFQYDQQLSELFPKMKIESLQNISKDVKLDIKFNLSQNISNNSHIINIQKEMERLKVSNLRLNFEYYQFQDQFLENIILPALQNQGLTHFDLVLNQKQTSNINSEVFTKIGQHFNKLNLVSLKLVLKDQSNYLSQFTQNYQLILDQLKNSKTLVNLSLYKQMFGFENQQQYYKYINRLVNFTSTFQE